MQKGFGIAEIVLSLGIFLVIMVSIFQYSATLYKKINTHHYAQSTGVFPFGLDTYRYGETFCDISVGVAMQDYIDISSLLSTSTPVTSIHSLGDEEFVFTSDSASTSEPDVFKIRLYAGVAELIESKDVGPGLQDSVLMFPYLYIANTSVNSHVKVLRIDSTLNEMQSIRIPTLSTSNAMPRRLNVFGDHLMLGTEKSSAGGELFALPIAINGALLMPTYTLELGGQAHASRIIGNMMYTANSADPEMRVYDSEFTQINTYDAPLTLGNGKAILGMYPYVILGRTLGTGELTVLDNSSTTLSVVDTARTNGSVDDLQLINSETFIAFTSNPDKEIQFWQIEHAKLKLIHFINLPSRVTAYTCAHNTLFVISLINERPTLITIQ